MRTLIRDSRSRAVELAQIKLGSRGLVRGGRFRREMRWRAVLCDAAGARGDAGGSLVAGLGRDGVHGRGAVAVDALRRAKRGRAAG